MKEREKKPKKPRSPKKTKTSSVRKKISKKEEAPVSEQELALLFENPQVKEQKSPKKVNKMKKWALYILLVFLAFSLTTILGIYYLLKLSLPLEQGKIMLFGIENPVEIRRDSLGVPLIRAKSEKDLFFGIGYTMAQDRLWQISFLRLLALGKSAEILGEKTLPIDVYLRLVGISRYAERMYLELPEFYKENLKAFVLGINTYIQENKNLPAEFLLTGYTPEPWSEKDVLSLYNFFNFSLATNHHEELAFLQLAAKLGYEQALYLFPIHPDEELPFSELKKFKDIPAEGFLKASEKISFLLHKSQELFPNSFAASNNWVIHPQKTVKGKALLANDTHLQITIPPAWYLLHVEAPTYKAAGVALPGVPLVALGYNGHIAWGATMVMADNQDIYIEKIKKTQDGLYFLENNQWKKALAKEEIFWVKNKGEQKIKFYFTNRGPLINEAVKESPLIPLQPPKIVTDYGLSLRQVVADGDRAAIGFYLLGKAKTILEARKAISYIDGICLNLVLSDGENIAWQVSGRYPIRKNHRGLFPSPGWDKRYHWQGYYPFEKNPFAMNPPEKFIATANHKTTQAKDILLSSSWYSPGRFLRAKEILSQNKKFSRKDMHVMQQDQTSIIAKRLSQFFQNRKTLQKEIEKLPYPKKEKAQEAYQALLNFSGELSAYSKEALIYGVFWHSLAQNLFGDELGIHSDAWKTFEAVNRRSYDAIEDHLFYREESPFWDNVNTPEKESKDKILAISLSETIHYIEKNAGKVRFNWQWGKLHTYEWVHDLARQVKILSPFLSRGPYPAGGDKHTLNVASYSWGSDFSVWLIAAMRLVVDFSEEEPLELILPTGNSGNFLSAYYDNMLFDYLSGKNHTIYFTAKNIEKFYPTVLELHPRK